MLESKAWRRGRSTLFLWCLSLAAGRTCHHSLHGCKDPTDGCFGIASKSKTKKSQAQSPKDLVKNEVPLPRIKIVQIGRRTLRTSS